MHRWMHAFILVGNILLYSFKTLIVIDAKENEKWVIWNHMENNLKIIQTDKDLYRGKTEKNFLLFCRAAAQVIVELYKLMKIIRV